MYASVTVIEVRGAVDALLDVIRDDLLPAAKAQEGFVGLEVL